MKIQRALALWVSVGLIGLVGISVAGAQEAPAANAQQAPTASAQEAPTASAQEATAADRTLAGDAVCTRCHHETEPKPILAMYKTRHGVTADERTPGCQSCHGPSVAHQKNIGGSASQRTPVS